MSVRAAAQGLVARPGRDRQQVGQHASLDAAGQQRRQVCLQLIQLRGRAAVRGPVDTGLDATAARAAEPRQPHRDGAEQRRDLTRLPVLDVAARPAARTRRPQCRMVAGLHGRDRLLHPGQQLLGLRQRQPQVGDVAQVTRPVEFQDVDPAPSSVSSRLD